MIDYYNIIKIKDKVNGSHFRIFMSNGKYMDNKKYKYAMEANYQAQLILEKNNIRFKRRYQITSINVKRHCERLPKGTGV